MPALSNVLLSSRRVRAAPPQPPSLLPPSLQGTRSPTLVPNYRPENCLCQKKRNDSASFCCIISVSSRERKNNLGSGRRRGEERRDAGCATGPKTCGTVGAANVKLAQFRDSRTCMEVVISCRAESASCCLVLSSALCSAARLFSSSTSALASFSLDTPACRKTAKNKQSRRSFSKVLLVFYFFFFAGKQTKLRPQL